MIEYSINMNVERLREYDTTDLKDASSLDTGTLVRFQNISDEISKEWVDFKLIHYLSSCFAWYLSAHPEKNIYVNGEVLDVASLASDKEDFDLTVDDKKTFHCRYFAWKTKLVDEYSRFYFLGKDGIQRNTTTTTFNNKGDDFWHSIVVQDAFFDSMTDSDTIEGSNLFSDTVSSKIFTELKNKLNDYLRDKRRPFMKLQSQRLVENYSTEMIFPKFGSSVWEQCKKSQLEEFVKELYIVEPKVFVNLNEQQKIIFIRLLNEIMDTDRNESLFKILEAVVDLDEADKNTFAGLLQETKLKHIISTLELISDRLTTISNIRELVFHHEMKAGEIKHLQKVLEKHYWIFGEQYNLVCAEEVNFEKALNKYLYLLRGVNEKEYIQDPNKYKQMDLFLSGRDRIEGKPSNLVVEIKNPTTVLKLKQEHYNQLVKYVVTILNEDRFNANGESWTFMLIGQEYDADVKVNISDEGTGLTVAKPNYKIYVKKWSDILNEAELRLLFRKDKYQAAREVATQEFTADGLTQKLLNNSAVV